MTNFKFKKQLTFLFILIGIFAISKCDFSSSGETSNLKPQTSNSELAYLNHHDSVKYVGIETCKSCHYSIWETFVKTGMGSSFGAADTSKSIAEIDGHSTIFDPHSNFYYHPFWESDSLKISEFRLENGDTVFQKKQTIDYVVGSGQHTNSHIFQQNGFLHQAPFTWYAQKGKLDLPPGYEDGGNVRFSRKIGLECTSCHNAMPTGFVKGSVHRYQKVPGAIDCERCHGPGELHVQRMRRGEFVDTSQEIDYSIVSLKKLPYELQFEVCQRCHLQGNAVLAEGKSFFDFRPGMRLNEVMDIYLPRYEGSEDKFIMASHIDRFKQSECFIQSDKEFNCISCHNPHVSVKETKIEKFNLTCQKCHQNESKFECEEELAVLQENDFNCVKCHMPQSISTDIPHVTVHDHKIDIPKELKDTSGLGKFLELVAVNNSKPTDRSKTLGYLQQFEKFSQEPIFLDSALYFLNKIKNEKGAAKLWIHYYFLKNDFRKMKSFAEKLGDDFWQNELSKISYDNSDGWTAYRIGEGYFNLGLPKKAEIFYNKATELVQYEADFWNKLGTAQAAQGKSKMAMESYKRALTLNPEHGTALNNLGFEYLQQQKLELAELQFDRALAQNPDYELAWLNKANLEILRGNNAAALKALEEALRINPENPRARQAMTYLKKPVLRKIIFGILAVLMVGGGIFAFVFYQRIFAPNVDLGDKETFFLKIPTGATYEWVLDSLSENEILKKQKGFDWVADRKNYPSLVKAGRYEIPNGMSNNDLVNKLRSGDQDPIQLTLNNLSGIYKLSGELGEVLEPDSLDFLQLLESEAALSAFGVNPKTVSAYFLPNTYEVWWNTSPSAFLQRMHREFDNYFDEERKRKAKKLNLNPIEVVTLASIVQSETAMNDEKPIVAGLYLNRLRRGIKLQSDPTSVYGYLLDHPTEQIRRVYYKQTRYDSEFNTYIYGGLPPGPIRIPDLSSIEAVLNPADHGYIFMAADPERSGYHNFAKTNAQHTRNARKYREWANRAGVR